MPEPWPGASQPPYYNVVGLDPELTDPEHGDYRPLPGSPATAYGCQTFPAGGGTVAAAHAPTSGPGNMPRPLDGRAEQVAGPILTDTVWAADTILVVGDVTIESQVHLTIAPGVRVLFDGHYGLYVQGTLTAVGTPSDWILLDSRHPEAFAVDSTTTGCWHGIRFPWTSSANDSSRLAYCIIAHCKAAGDSSRGAALSTDGFSKLAVTNCILRDNVADIGGALYCSNFAAPALTGCLITGNHGFRGGSVYYAQDAYPALINCTIVANPVHEEGIFENTNALHNHISKSKVTNCIVRTNPSQYFLGGQIYEGKPFYVTYCDIEDGYPGVGNFDADPVFVDSGPHPFSLQEGSPCINAGRPDLAGLGLPPFDLAGGPRVVEGRIDVGAYEWAAAGAVAEDGGHGAAATAATSGAWLELAGANPGRGSVTLAFGLAHAQRVELAVFDAAGRLQAVLREGPADAGVHVVAWDGRNGRGAAVEAGVYFARLSAGSQTLACARVVRAR
jgi:hypothetical protein